MIGRDSRRRGVTRGDVVVLVLVLGATGLLVLMGLARTRETARLAGCGRNLAQIGFALAIHDQMHGHLPAIEGLLPPGATTAGGPVGPLRAMLETLDLPDFTELRDPKTRPKARQGPVPGEIPVPGFSCASDPNAISGRLPAPVSYRAATGGGPTGDDGAFSPGRSWSLAAVEARDGLSYTAAFSERLVGGGGEGAPNSRIYRVVQGPLPDSGCPESPDAADARDDAGSSWIASDYRSTLYNHALPPNGRPSCIARDGQSAFMGASSGHVRGVNLLKLDGSVTLTVPSIAPKIWRDLAAITQSP